eukprot:11794737-Alexandrium_andersonii.AAC.1
MAGHPQVELSSELLTLPYSIPVPNRFMRTQAGPPNHNVPARSYLRAARGTGLGPTTERPGSGPPSASRGGRVQLGVVRQVGGQPLVLRGPGSGRLL